MKTPLIAVCLLSAAVCPALGQNIPSAYTAFSPTSTFVIAEHGTDAKLKEGLTAIDPVNEVNCTSAAGCTLMATSQMDVIGHSAYLLICTLVDGSPIGEQCSQAARKSVENTYYLGETYIEGPQSNTQIAINLSSGTHTVETSTHLKCYCEIVTTSAKTWTISYTLYGH